MIDTHAHLDACEGDADALVREAAEAGIGQIVAVGSGIDSCCETLAIASRNTGVYAALGIHPHQAGGDEASRLDELRDLLREEVAVAVGEAGLDFFRDYAPRAAQLRLFDEELTLAAELELPVVVHSRAASAETAEALRGFTGTVVLHCFSSSDLLAVALDRGYYVSFAGNVTYPGAHDLRRAAAAVPAERILVETDSPYLAPVPRRGRANVPANVIHSLAALADARGEDSGALAIRIDANAATAFGLP